MKTALKGVLMATALIVSAHAAADITFYQGENYRGKPFTTDRPVANLERFGFNDRASSAVVRGQSWEVCDDFRFGGRCVILRPGNYPSLASMGLDDRVSSIRMAGRYAPPVAAAPAAAQITFYEREEFRGRTFTTDQPVRDLDDFGFNNRASSVVVAGDRWEVCEDARFGGRCLVLRPGNYPSLASMGLDKSITSARNLDRQAGYDERRWRE